MPDCLFCAIAGGEVPADKVRETERQEIETALRRSGWNVTRAAEQMKLPRRTLVYRMARLGLRRPRGAR